MLASSQKARLSTQIQTVIQQVWRENPDVRPTIRCSKQAPITGKISSEECVWVYQPSPNGGRKGSKYAWTRGTLSVEHIDEGFLQCNEDGSFHVKGQEYSGEVTAAPRSIWHRLARWL